MVSTLALVIGASTAIFSTLYGVVLQPLPYPDPGRLVAISESDRAIGAANTLVTNGVVPILIQDSRSFERVGAWSPARANPQDIFAVRLWGTDQPIIQQYCTSGVFAALRVTPMLGRNFSADEDAASAENSHIAILSYGFWQAHYGGDPEVLGRTLSVNVFGVKQDEAIVGVMPEGVAFPSPFSAVRPDVWINLRLVATPFLLGHQLNVVARLKPGVSLAQGRAELSTMGDRIRTDQRTYKDITLQAAPLQDALVRGVQPILWPLVAALGAILIAGCTNIACLLVVRAGTRRRELAVRAALGAGRFALVRETLTETLTLSAIGGALGLMLAAGGLRLLVAVMPASLHVPRLDAVPLEWPVLLIAAGVSAAVAVVFGAWPALRLLRPALVDDLKASDTAQERRGSLARMTGWLLTGEIAVALVLVTGTALLTQSVRRFLDANALFQPGHLASFGVGFTNAYVHATPDFETQFPVLYAQFRARVEAMPGVRAVTFLDHWPVRSLADFPNTFSERGSGPDARARLPAEMEVVDESYRDVAHTTLARGRWFADMDTKAAPPVAVINAAMAERYFAGRDPIGVSIAPKSLRWTDDEVFYTIIGVVDEPRRFGTGLAADPTVFLDITQVPVSSRWVVVRTSGDPAALLTPLRQAALAIMPGAMSVGRLQTGEDVTAESSARARFASWLLTAFSGLALVLALVGISAVVSYETSRRHREIGIRMALGATPRGVTRLVARGVGLQVGAGILGGLIAAYLFGRTLSGLLYGTSPSDPTSFAEGALAVIFVAMLASYLPARRAAAIDPLLALRRD